MSTILLVLLFLAISVVGEGFRRNLRGQRQENDEVYVLSYRWSPGFCNKDPSSSDFLLCRKPNDYMKENFVVDNFWLQKPGSTSVMKNCGGDDYDPFLMRGADWDQLVRYWPNFQYNEYEESYHSHWQSSWETYGRCTGLSQAEYFNRALQMLKAVGTPDIIRNNVGGQVAVDMVKPSLSGLETASSLQCQKNEHLLGAKVCWAKGADGVPLIQEVCPTNVQEMDSCDMGMLQISAF